MPRARRVPNRQMMRPPVPTVGASQLPPLVPPAPAPRAKQKRNTRRGLSIAPGAVLHDPAPPHTVLAGRAFRAPEIEQASVLGGMQPGTKPSAQFASRADAQLGNAVRVGARPEDMGR